MNLCIAGRRPRTTNSQGYRLRLTAELLGALDLPQRLPPVHEPPSGSRRCERQKWAGCSRCSGARGLSGWSMNFKRGCFLTALAIFAGTAGGQPALSAPNLVECPPRWGEAGKPLVTSASTARAIFVAVEKDFFPHADAKRFPIVKADEDGDGWAVFRTRPIRRVGKNLEVTFGGGQLELRIAKCDGAISQVHLSRKCQHRTNVRNGSI